MQWASHILKWLNFYTLGIPISLSSLLLLFISDYFWRKASAPTTFIWIYKAAEAICSVLSSAGKLFSCVWYWVMRCKRLQHRAVSFLSFSVIFLQYWPDFILWRLKTPTYVAQIIITSNSSRSESVPHFDRSWRNSPILLSLQFYSFVLLLFKTLIHIFYIIQNAFVVIIRQRTFLWSFICPLVSQSNICALMQLFLD